MRGVQRHDRLSSALAVNDRSLIKFGVVKEMM
jgi:hypothetical protein